MNMQDEVIRILTFYHGDNNFNMNPHVPAEIEHYARAALDIADDDIVLAAIRLSFTKFHRGLVITRDGLFWRNGPKIETTVNHLTWRELSLRKSNFRPKPKSIDLGDGDAIDNTGSINKSSAVINLLDLLIDKYSEQALESDGFVFESGKDELARNIPTNKAELKQENTQSAAEANDGKSFLGDWFKSLLSK
ncbi:hypothetical protein [Psychromonas algicola]|uniref:hypothetical protein n=1 Tax=Psychromonas algicola TaxID=2555642 RepID=UPI001067CDF3|nr:hypothetical protein [Psychromonas sp. RZ5]TEW51501.1 hypothetical protein E2R67_06960 [Psychromonas sp. RZ5]